MGSMSESSPEVYEQGRGMDAHNKVMREIRGRNDTTHDPREPTRVWLDEDNTPDGVYDSLTIILNTGGCRWARAGGCTMCGYVAESVEGGTVPHEDLLAQVEAALDHEREHATEPAGQVKIYTSGSFLDEREVPAETRRAIADTFADRDRLVVESLPDFVDREAVATFTDRGIETDIAVGLETATDRVRHDCVNKYFDFADFEAAAAEATVAGAGVKAYLLLKPPFLSEGEALADMRSSVRRCAGVSGVHTVSMNPTNVQRHTMVEDLYNAGGYHRRGSGRSPRCSNRPPTRRSSSSRTPSVPGVTAGHTTAASATSASSGQSRTSTCARTRRSSSRSTVTAGTRGRPSSSANAGTGSRSRGDGLPARPALGEPV